MTHLIIYISYLHEVVNNVWNKELFGNNCFFFFTKLRLHTSHFPKSTCLNGTYLALGNVVVGFMLR